MSQVFNLKLSRPQREILLAMADHARVDGAKVYPSVGLIAWKTDYSERQVRRIIAELKSSGLLIPIAHTKGGRNPVTMRGYSTIYQINLSAGIPKIPFKKNVSLYDTQMSAKSDTRTLGSSNPDIDDGKADTQMSAKSEVESEVESEKVCGVFPLKNAFGSIHSEKIIDDYFKSSERHHNIQNSIGFRRFLKSGKADAEISNWLKFGDDFFNLSVEWLENYEKKQSAESDSSDIGFYF